MYRRRLLPLIVAGFLGLFIIGGLRSTAYRSGYMQGLNAGRAQVERSIPSQSERFEQPAPNLEGERGDGPRGEFRGDAEFNRGNDRFEGRSGHHGYHGHHGHHRGFGFFGFIGGLFRFLFTIVFFVFLFKLFTKGRFGRRMRGRWNSDWRNEMRSKWNENFGSDTDSGNDSNDPPTKTSQYTDM